MCHKYGYYSNWLFFIDGHVTRCIYLPFLKEAITPGVEIAENYFFDYDPIFQHVEVPPHVYVPIREYQYGQFPCRGLMSWLP